MPSYQQLLRLPEVMHRTGMSRSFLYKAASEGSLKFHKVAERLGEPVPTKEEA